MRAVSAAAIVLAFALVPITDASAVRTRPEYRYFRALSIDLLGRPPTRDELAELERTDFDFGAWIDRHLSGQAYTERMRRIYMDLLRLDLAPTVTFEPSSVMLRYHRILGPRGEHVIVHYRLGQRRALAAIDGDFCFTADESGLRIPPAGSPSGTAKPISQTLLDARTVSVKPWWLYADYRNRDPQDRSGPDWTQRFPGFELVSSQFVEPDGSPTTAVRVCREEAQIADTGRVYASGRPPVRKSDPFPFARLTRLPTDTDFAKAHRGRPVSCLSHTGFQSSIECGCGVGLERCIPYGPNGFVIPILAPLGMTEPFTAVPRPPSAWVRQWWAEEARRFIDRIFRDDRDVRELLTSRATTINGPLAQFYRFFAGATCCGPGLELGYARPEPLFDPAAIPTSLIPHDTTAWMTIADRGPHAAGLMTMPIFLEKYGSRRARAHVIYQAFQCKDFVAPAAKLVPSKEPDLAKRRGCASCHRTLEPMAAYFARVQESDWTYLPKAEFPVTQPGCAIATNGRMSPACKAFYDPEFSDYQQGTLRGAYNAPTHADAGPAGLAAQVVASQDFAPCVAQNIAQSFLGRALGPDDQEWKAALARTLVDNGYRARPLVRAIVTSSQYRKRDEKRPAP